MRHSLTRPATTQPAEHVVHWLAHRSERCRGTQVRPNAKWVGPLVMQKSGSFFEPPGHVLVDSVRHDALLVCLKQFPLLGR